jgi:hypothetical protein
MISENSDSNKHINESAISGEQIFNKILHDLCSRHVNHDYLHLLEKKQKIKYTRNRSSFFGNESYQKRPKSLVYYFLVSSMFGNDIKFSKTVRGAIIGNLAEFEQEFSSPKTYGVLKTKSHLEKKTNQWVVEELIV